MAILDAQAIGGQSPELLSFVVENGEQLPQGINIESDLEAAMSQHGGTLQYWAEGAEVGTCRGFDRTYFQRKFDATCQILSDKGIEVDYQDIEDTQAFIDEIFGVYDGSREPYRHGGTFAFVAASRTQRRAEGEFAAIDYRRETVGCLPILKYVDESTAQRVLVGMPPFVLDYYGESDANEGGVMIFAPLSLDLVQDSGDKVFEVAGNAAQETSWFAAERLGVQLMSLAAQLPRATGWGSMFAREGMITTTGHGGTTWLIGETVDKAIAEGRVDPSLAHRRSVLGVGGIGEAVADLMLGQDPDVQVAINDHNPLRQQEVADKLRAKYGEGRVLIKPDVADLLKFGGVTVSAITKSVDLNRTRLQPGDLEGRVYADDSQPAAIAAEQVIALGGLHVGVIAGDGTTFGAVTGKRFNYGQQGPLELSDAYGCCVEGATLFYGRGGELALSNQVDGDQTRRIGEICTELGFRAADLQTILDGKSQRV